MMNSDEMQVFTFVDEDGEVMHFPVSLMEQCILHSPESVLKVNVPIDEELINYLKTNQGVEEPRVNNLTEKQRDKPVFLADFSGKKNVKGGAIIVDGNHRVVRRFKDGFRDVNAYFFPESVWRNLLIETNSKAVHDELVQATKEQRRHNLHRGDN